jgi:hypothetical protein
MLHVLFFVLFYFNCSCNTGFRHAQIQLTVSTEARINLGLTAITIVTSSYSVQPVMIPAETDVPVFSSRFIIE